MINSQEQFFNKLFSLEPGESLQIQIPDLYEIFRSSFPRRCREVPYREDKILFYEPRPWHFDDYIESFKTNGLQVVKFLEHNAYLFKNIKIN